MKKALLLSSLLVWFMAVNTYGQANIFNPNDSVITYSSSRPPTTPKANTMAKWVRTVRMSWNTNKFKAYYWNGMAFRLRFPNNYDITKADKYPIMIFFHGAGEIAPVTDNENQLIWGAQPFEAMMNAGTAGSFNNAFLLFPQVIQSIGWQDSLYVKVNSVMDSLQKYCNVDPDRVVAQGLSNGGFGALSYTTLYPSRVATVISASPALVQNLIFRQPNSVHIPMWLSSGGQDLNPDPASVNQYVDSFTAKGGNIRYTFYPNLGHNTWSSQWLEPYMVPYWNAAYKSNPLLYFQRSQFCSDSAFAARMGITAGFYQYEWQKDGVTISGATSNEYTATQFGSYRVRFKRTAAGAWSVYSPNPIVITATPSTTTPPVQITGVSSKVLPATDGSTTTPLELPTGYNAYEWRNATTNAILSTNRTYAAPVGLYKARSFGCNANFSNFTVISANGVPKPDSAYGLALTRISPTSIKLTWSEKANSSRPETGFEVYRGLTASGPYTLATITPANTLTYTDTSIADNYNFYYVVRAVNDNGAAPLSNQATLQPASDNSAPTVPANVKAVLPGRKSVQLSWDKSSDNIGVTKYDVYVNGIKKYSTTTNQVTADGLTANTSYFFKIKALDQMGNSSAFSDSVRATTVVNGLKYSYYEGTWTMLPDFSKLTPVKVDTSANVNIAKRPTGVDNYFAFVWEGYINIKTPGTYTFETNSDDGSKLYFNTLYSPTATELVNNDGSHGAISATGSVTVDSAGLYPITITYFEKDAGESMNVYWTGPGILRQPIPNAAFTEAYQLPVDNSAPTTPSALKAAYTGRTFVDLTWGASTDNIGVTKYDIYVNGVKRDSSTTNSFKVDSLNPNTNYTFRIKARDLASNASAFSDSVKVNTTATNLKYKFYQGSFSALPDFSTLTPVQTGTTSNALLSVKPSAVTTNYAFVWEGYINIKTAGDYTFETASDDGSKLYFNSFYSPYAIELVDNDGQHGTGTAVAGTVANLTPGMYPITITYFQKDLSAAINLYWTGPGILRQQIPDSAFTEAFNLPGDNVPPSKVTSLASTYTGRNFTELNWKSATDNVGVAGYDVYVNGTKKYTTTDTSFKADGLTPNTVYNFKVKAFDYRNNASTAFSDSVKVTTGAINLKYRYYEGTWDSLPNFDLYAPVKTGTTTNTLLTVKPAAVTSNYGIVWEGYINIKTPGDYTFETTSDDGSKFYFNSFYADDSIAVANNDGLHGAITAKGTVRVNAAGLYPVAITYFQKDAGASMQTYWTGPGIARQLIPDSAFTDNFKLPGDATPPTKPATLAARYTGRTFVELAWNKSTDNIGVAGYDVYINGTKKYSTTDTTIKADSLITGTAYTFKVKAIDFSSNASAFSDSVKVTTGAINLKYGYYEGAWDSLPNFKALTAVKTGTSANVDINVKPTGVMNNYGIVWEGYINIRKEGDYTFETQSDDGSKFYFNTFYSPTAVALANNDGLHGAIVATGTVHATPGLYPIAITYFQREAGASMQAYWSGPGIARQLIPDAAFTDSYTVPGDAVAPSAVPDVRSNYTGRTFVDVAWTKATDNVGVAGYDVYVNGVKKYTTADTTVKADSLTANVAYTFKVKAFDQAGNVSATFADSVKVTTSANGLKYRYYEGNWAVLPDFNTLTALKTGTSANFDLSPKIASDRFGFVWEGYIKITTPGVYTFETQSDDGSKMYFNTLYSPTATALVDNDGQHGAIVKTGTTANLAAGWYPITVTFFDATLDESIKVFWTGPGISRQQIPDAAFVELVGSDVTPPTVVKNVKSNYTGRTFVDVAWNKSTDNVAVTGYDVYVNGVKKYSTADTTIKVDSLTANLAYTFKVKAFDQAGNVSAFGDSVKITTSANGLKYRYYEGNWAVLPNFNPLTALKTGTSANFDLTPKISNDNFGFVWEGYIKITTPGVYTFETQSDDGSKMYFNTLYSPTATALVDNDGQHGAIVKAGTTANLAAGWYPITVTFFDATLDESIKVFWTGPGISRQQIPDAAFVELVGSDVTPPTVVKSVKSNYTGRTFVDLAWNKSTDNVGVTGYDVYVNGVKKYSTTDSIIKVDSLTANIAYTFKVKAFDQAGNVSAFGDSVKVTTKASGLRYKYYEGSWTVLPNFSALTPVKTGTSTNFDLTPRISNDNFGFVWEGYIHITTPGVYTFETQSDDGSKLYFNTFYSSTATALVNNDGQHGAITVTGTTGSLAAGWYPITVTFFDATLDESIKVYWTGPGISRQLVPDAAFVESIPGFDDDSTATAGSATKLKNTATEQGSSAHITSAYPNPFNEALNISFYNSSSTNNIDVELYDMNGRMILNRHFGQVNAGNALLHLDLSGQSALKTGSYMARLKVNGLPARTWTLIKTQK